MRFVTQLDHPKWRSQTFTPEKVMNKTPKKENWEINPAASYIGIIWIANIWIPMKTRVGLGDEILLPSYIVFPGLLHKPVTMDRSMKQPGIYGRSLVGFDFVAPGSSICFLLKNHMKLQLHPLFCATKSHDIRAKNYNI